jgi:hypothetical protein
VAGAPFMPSCSTVAPGLMACRMGQIVLVVKVIIVHRKRTVLDPFLLSPRARSMQSYILACGQLRIHM